MKSTAVRMSANEHKCFIHIQLPGTTKQVPGASLSVKDLGGGAFEGVFTYDEQYLKRPDAIELDPFQLPLTDRPQLVTKLKGLPGAVRDAGPDAWGRRVIENKLGRAAADLREIDYLLSGPDDGAGNLNFGLSVEPPAAHCSFNRIEHLQALVQAAEMIAEDRRLPHRLLESVQPGTRMGGARPKASVEDNGSLWLAKFPEHGDLHNYQRIEYATLHLARAVGLNVCEARLEKLGGRDVLMLKRFDREWDQSTRNYFRRGLVSALTVLDAEDGHLGRERWSYLLLAAELRRWSTNSEADRIELFRRMVFNAMVTNNDDHPRNHALLRTDSGWRLSPAYDVVPFATVAQERRDLALVAGAFGRAASRYNLLSRCDAFGLDRAHAEVAIEEMLQVVKRWREHFAAHGVEARSIEMLEQAILPASFYQDKPPQTV